MQVSGTLVSTGSGSFGANLNLAPVPEPETYGMMLAGLGILGMLSRRRKNSSTAA
ncbi:MAG: FxDxF family PEP-CTERM protein [Telluria sp.]